MSCHDRREELNFRRHKDDEWTRLIPVPRASKDLWRPQVTTDNTGKPWLIWSQQEDGNWDVSPRTLCPISSPLSPALPMERST